MPAYEMRISDWSSDVCSSDLRRMTMRLSRISDSRAMIAGAVLGVSFAIAIQAQAAGSGMPWEEPLQQVLESVQGPVAKIVAVIQIGRASCRERVCQYV